MSRIEWTDVTWNPVRGCSRVSEGCRNCYAERMAARFSRDAFRDGKDGWPPGAFQGFARMTQNGPRWTGRVELIPSKLDEPLHWRKPRRVFVTSMSDAFHESLSDEKRDRIFAVVAMCPQHTFQNLTKRTENQRRYFSDPETPFRIRRAMDSIAVDLDMKGVGEEWRAVVGWTKYEVSNYGNVRREGRVLASIEHSGSYRQVALCENSEPKTRLVHVLVLEAFRGVPGEAFESRHRNGNRADNRLANLSWGSKADNMDDAARHGTAGAWAKSHATVSPAQVVEIRSRRAAGQKLAVIAQDLGITKQQVSAIALKKTFKPARLEWPLPNLWAGISCEDQKTADERIRLLLQTPAAVRFVSLEPLLGPIEFRPSWVAGYDYRGGLKYTAPRLDWVIVGGESGPGARPCDVAWIRSIVRRCREAGVPCFVKQLGARWARFGAAHRQIGSHRPKRVSPKGGDPAEWPEDLRVREFPA